MAIALKLYEDGRIHSASVVLPNGNYDGMPVVETLPDGNLPDYLYVDGAYVYDPVPVTEPEPEEPTPTLEERVSAVEDQLEFTKIILGVE